MEVHRWENLVPRRVSVLVRPEHPHGGMLRQRKPGMRFGYHKGSVMRIMIIKTMRYKWLSEEVVSFCHWLLLVLEASRGGEGKPVYLKQNIYLIF